VQAGVDPDRWLREITGADLSSYKTNKTGETVTTDVTFKML